MQLVLVHHAEAVDPAVDPQRPLSSAGHKHADALAARARDAGVVPAVIWHSGKMRSRQTAEAFWRACNPFASFKMVRGLRPEDPAVWIRDLLLVEDQDVLLVGHMPNLPSLLELLIGASAFPLHGLVWLERKEAEPFTERRRWPEGPS